MVAKKEKALKKPEQVVKPVRKQKTKKSPTQSKIAKLEEQVKSLKEASDELKERHLRLRAEFDNYRKRKEREVLRLLEYQGEDVIKSFLPVVDDLERMVQSANGNETTRIDSLIEGMELILDKLHRRLTTHGVEPFNSVGETFDPELHDAMMTQQSEDHEENVIIQEFEKGYKYKDKIIRHAKVIVNSSAREDTE